MIWLIRAGFFVLFTAPFVGAFLPIGASAPPHGEGFATSEAVLVWHAVTFAAINAAISFLFCLTAFALCCFSPCAVRHVRVLVIVLTLTFLLPAPLKATAFSLWWSMLPLIAQDFAFYAWTLIYGTAFMWFAVLALLSSDSQRSALEAVSELSTGLRRFLITARLAVLPLFAAGLCTFVLVLFAGREVRVLSRDATPIGDVINGLFGGRDWQAAALCLTLFLAMASVIMSTVLIWSRRSREVADVAGGSL